MIYCGLGRHNQTESLAVNSAAVGEQLVSNCTLISCIYRRIGLRAQEARKVQQKGGRGQSSAFDRRELTQRRLFSLRNSAASGNPSSAARFSQ